MDEFDNFLNSEGIVMNEKELKRFMKKIDKNNDQVFLQLTTVIYLHLYDILYSYGFTRVR